MEVSVSSTEILFAEVYPPKACVTKGLPTKISTYYLFKYTYFLIKFKMDKKGQQHQSRFPILC